MSTLSTEQLADLRTATVPRGLLTAHPIFIDRAKGVHVWDRDGRRYLDFVGGIGVLNVGHNHPRVAAAVAGQLERLIHTSFQVAGYESYLLLAERLGRLIGRGEAYKSLFLTTGAEAAENAIKIARAYTSRPGVIAFRDGFHGRTLLGVTLTGFAQPYRQNFGPFALEIFHTAYPDAYRGCSTEAAMTTLREVFATQIAPDRVAAIIIEPVQGDGGFIPAPVAFLQQLRQLTSDHGILLIADEIQTSFGRTGRMFGFEHADIQPDLVTVAKSLAAVMDAPLPGGLGGSYGGNPLGCAAALAVFDTFEEDDLLRRSVGLGRRLRAGLDGLKERHTAIGDVRGLGFMQAIEFASDRDSKASDPDRAHQVMEQARHDGLLVIKCGVHRNVIRFLGPLVASDDDVDEALAIMDGALSKAGRS